MVRSILAALAVICMAGAARAVTPALGTPVCADGGTCVTDGSDRIIVERTGAIGVGIMFGFDSDVYVDGDAACAAINMTCAISWDGNNADVGTQVACATDQGAGEWGLAQCY